MPAVGGYIPPGITGVGAYVFVAGIPGFGVAGGYIPEAGSPLYIPEVVAICIPATGLIAGDSYAPGILGAGAMGIPVAGSITGGAYMPVDAGIGLPVAGLITIPPPFIPD